MMGMSRKSSKRPTGKSHNEDTRTQRNVESTTHRRIDDPNVPEVCVLSRRVLHLYNRLADALQVAQRILQDAVVFRAGAVRCHRDYWHHVAVAVIVVDGDVVVLRMSGWRGYGDCVVISGIEMIIGTASGRSISVS